MHNYASKIRLSHSVFQPTVPTAYKPVRRLRVVWLISKWQQCRCVQRRHVGG